jgi:creatinine amidohydrolase
MRFDELNWFDIETYLKKDDRIIFILGACEQHGYLSLTTDVQIPQALADAASQKTGVLIAPTLNFGVSPYFLQYPGTISVRISTLLDFIEDVTRSLHQQGFKKILFLNGHGGNTSAQSRLYELANQLPDLKLVWYAWWQSHSVASIAQKYDLKPTHASWLEAFQFTRVADLPEGTKAPPFVPGLINSWQAKEIYGDGNFGGPYSVSPHIMDEIFNTALKDILFLLKFEDNRDKPTR